MQLPRVFKADELPQEKRIRPLSNALAARQVPHADDETGAAAKDDSSAPVETDAAGVVRERHSPQVSADSLERVQRLLHEVVAGFERQRAQLLQQLKPGLTKLVIAVAQRVVDRELATDEEVIRRVIDAAIDEIGRSGIVTVRVSPEDAGALRDAIRQDEWHPPTTVELEIVADPAVARGGCMLESDYGQVDATVETQIAQLARFLDAEGGQ